MLKSGEKWEKVYIFAAEKTIETKMCYLVGHHNCKLDAKGRVLVPSEFKEQLGSEVDEGFVLRPGLHSPCLELYTKNDWYAVQDQLRAKFSQFNVKEEAVMRKYDSGARFVKLDGSGRLQIPKDLIEKGSLVKDIIITAVTTKMEIWDKDLYEQSINNDIDDEEFFRLLSENIK